MSFVTLLTEFNIEAVYRQLGLRKNQRLEREAARFVYREFTEGEYKSDTRKQAADEAVWAMVHRYDMYNTYAEDFFQNRPYDKKALVLAILCDRSLDNASNFKKDDDDTDEMEEPLPPASPEIYLTGGGMPLVLEHFNTTRSLRQRRDFHDDRAISIAHDLYEEASDLTDLGLKQDEDALEEALFLAHVNAIDNFRERIASIQEDEVEDLIELRNDHIRGARNFVRRGSLIGRELLRTIAELEEAIDQNMPTALIHPFVRAQSGKPPFSGEANIIAFPKPPISRISPYDDPVEYLIRQYEAPFENDAVRHATKAFWDNLYGQHGENFDEAMRQAASLMDRRMTLFNKYAQDFDFRTDSDYETALCAWIVHDIVDIHDEDDWKFMSEKTVGILAHLDDPAHIRPVLSDSYGDAALKYCLGLVIVQTLDALHRQYEPGKSLPHGANAEQQKADADYCLRLTDDLPVMIDSLLENDIRELARDTEARLHTLKKLPVLRLIKQ